MRIYYPGNKRIREERRDNKKHRWVKELQKELKRRGYKNFKVDGGWDLDTKNAVKRFQKKRGMKPDGIPGPNTWAKLFGPQSVPPQQTRWPYLFMAPGTAYANDHLSVAMNNLGRNLWNRHSKQLYVVSGRRTMAQQRYLWNLYQSGKGNLAAYPSRNAPHIRNGGSAYDCGTRTKNGTNYRSFMYDRDAVNLMGKYGIRNTVPSEAWHMERP